MTRDRLWPGSRKEKQRVLDAITQEFKNPVYADASLAAKEKETVRKLTNEQVHTKVDNHVKNGHWEWHQDRARRTLAQREGKRAQKVSFANSANSVRSAAQIREGPFEVAAARERQMSGVPFEMSDDRVEQLCQIVLRDLETCLKAMGMNEVADLSLRKGTEQVSREVISSVLFPLFVSLEMTCNPEEVILDEHTRNMVARSDYIFRDRHNLPVLVVEAKRCYGCHYDWVAELCDGLMQCFDKYLRYHWEKEYQPLRSARHSLITCIITDGLRWIFAKAGNRYQQHLSSKQGDTAISVVLLSVPPQDHCVNPDADAVDG